MTLFWKIRTGRVPACSEPRIGLRSASQMSPRLTVIWRPLLTALQHTPPYLLLLSCGLHQQIQHTMPPVAPHQARVLCFEHGISGMPDNRQPPQALASFNISICSTTCSFVDIKHSPGSARILCQDRAIGTMFQSFSAKRSSPIRAASNCVYGKTSFAERLAMLAAQRSMIWLGSPSIANGYKPSLGRPLEIIDICFHVAYSLPCKLTLRARGSSQNDHFPPSSCF